MAKVLKFWHQWSWLISIIGYVFMMGAGYATITSSVADNAKELAVLKQQNLDHRVTVLEQVALDNRDTLLSIKEVQGKIFDRINTIADRGH